MVARALDARAGAADDQWTSEREDTAASFTPSGFFALRTPLLPFRELLGWAEGTKAGSAPGDPAALARDRELLRSRLREIVARPEVREAIFVSSPTLEALIDGWASDPETRRGAECERALVRFLARMAARPTPFGLFAGVSRGAVGDETSLTLERMGAYRRHTRLDAAFLVEVLERLPASPERRESTSFEPNPTLYRSGERRRYVRSRPGADERRHVLVSVRDSPALRTALEAAEDGALPAQVADALVATGLAADRAQSFVDDLIAQQLLLPTLDLQVTGADATYGLADAVPALAAAQGELAELDAEELGVSPDRYRRIAAGLEGLTAEPRLDRLFQVDMRKPSPRATLGTDVVREILRGVELRRRVARPAEDAALERFVERFRERFEGRAVPLLEALDPDTGIVFDGEDSAPAPLLADLRAGDARARDATWGKREEHLLSRLLDLQAAGEEELVFEERDLGVLERPDAPPCPDAFGAMAVLAARSDAALASGRFRVFVLGADGPSGARLLGRFCHTDADLRAAVEAHLRAEEARDPDAVFAEIVHLPRARDVNVVARPVLRRYEIECLGRPGAPPENRLPLDDLLISLDGEQLVLQSQRLGRRIVPRLTSAHNFLARGVSVYRLLCRLQAQGLSVGGFFWGPLGTAPWLPRVRSGRVVLERARWRIDAHALGLPDDRDAAFAVLQDWRRSHRVPRFVSLDSGPVELPVDLDNVLAVDTLGQAVRAHGSAQLVELFPPPDELRVHGPEGAFVHELVVPFVRSAPAPPRSRRGSDRTVARTFPPGSEWLYARIYTGETAADAVLTADIAALVAELVDSGVADRGSSSATRTRSSICACASTATPAGCTRRRCRLSRRPAPRFSSAGSPGGSSSGRTNARSSATAGRRPSSSPSAPSTPTATLFWRSCPGSSRARSGGGSASSGCIACSSTSASTVRAESSSPGERAIRWPAPSAGTTASAAASARGSAARGPSSSACSTPTRPGRRASRPASRSSPSGRVCSSRSGENSRGWTRGAA